MNLKCKLIRTLWVTLPAREQKGMVNDFLDWLYADLPAGERRKKIERHTPRLIEWISEGHIGLSLLVYQHLRRLPLVSALIQWASEPKAATE